MNSLLSHLEGVGNPQNPSESKKSRGDTYSAEHFVEIFEFFSANRLGGWVSIPMIGVLWPPTRAEKQRFEDSKMIGTTLHQCYVRSRFKNIKHSYVEILAIKLP